MHVLVWPGNGQPLFRDRGSCLLFLLIRNMDICRSGMGAERDTSHSNPFAKRTLNRVLLLVVSSPKANRDFAFPFLHGSVGVSTNTQGFDLLSCACGHPGSSTQTIRSPLGVRVCKRLGYHLTCILPLAQALRWT